MLPYIVITGIWLSTYWVMFAVGVCSMGYLMFRRRRKYRFSAVQATIVTVALVVCGVVGTKLLYILENWKTVLEKGFSISGGLSFFGAVFLVPVLMPLVGQLLKISAGQMLDICAPCGAAMVGFMRFGCFLNGCCGGWEADVCGVRFCWPTQAMESVGDFLILGFLLRMEAKGIHPGRRYAVFLVGYGVLRFFVEFLRDTPKVMLGLGNGQWLAILGALIGGLVLLQEKQTRKDKK